MLPLRCGLLDVTSSGLVGQTLLVLLHHLAELVVHDSDVECKQNIADGVHIFGLHIICMSGQMAVRENMPSGGGHEGDVVGSASLNRAQFLLQLRVNTLHQE